MPIVNRNVPNQPYPPQKTMRFRAQQHQNRMPEVNLVPMMDVIMTILTFFIIISMSLNDFQSIEIRLPSKGSANHNSDSDPKSTGKDALIIAINPKRELFINQKPTTREQLIPQSRAYLRANPEGKVIIVADKTVPYEAVLQTLTTLRDLGGDRVSLSFQ
jgi:biopolymer transport protein ExbD